MTEITDTQTLINAARKNTLEKLKSEGLDLTKLEPNEKAAFEMGLAAGVQSAVRYFTGGD